MIHPDGISNCTNRPGSKATKRFREANRRPANVLTNSCSLPTPIGPSVSRRTSWRPVCHCGALVWSATNANTSSHRPRDLDTGRQVDHRDLLVQGSPSVCSVPGRRATQRCPAVPLIGCLFHCSQNRPVELTLGDRLPFEPSARDSDTEPACRATPRRQSPVGLTHLHSHPDPRCTPRQPCESSGSARRRAAPSGPRSAVQS